MVVLPIGPRNNTASLLVDSTKSHACWLAGSRAQFLTTEGDRTTTTTQKWKQKHSYNCHCWSEMLYCHLMATSKSLQITFQFENILWNEKRSCKMPFFSFICCWTNSSEWACEHDLSLLCCVVLLKNRHCAEHGFFFSFCFIARATIIFLSSFLHANTQLVAVYCYLRLFIALASTPPAIPPAALAPNERALSLWQKWNSLFCAESSTSPHCIPIFFYPTTIAISKASSTFQFLLMLHRWIYYTQTHKKRGKTHKYTQKMPKYSVISDFSFHFVSGSEWRGKGISVNGR